MAEIRIVGPASEVLLGEPDEDGDYRWTCQGCDEQGDAWRPLDEAVEYAEAHVDGQCRLLLLTA
jgi:hypothetical protein